MTKPISPSEVHNHIPDEVFESFNELIQENFSGFESTFEQSIVVDLICQKK